MGWLVGFEPTYERVTVVCVNRFTIATINGKMARLRGFEPLTYGLEVRCSIQLSYRRKSKGFTKSPVCVALQPYLLQQRTSPYASVLNYCTYRNWQKMVGVRGFEPPTPCSQGRCASQAALHPDGKKIYSTADNRMQAFLS